jgi:hypothetical protein
MIKKILDWILGKNEMPQESAAPYKVEIAPVVDATPTVVPAVETQPAPAPAPVMETAPLVETAPVTVKAKYKKAELEKMTKAQLVELAAKHGLELKARAPKVDLVKALTKV